MRWNKLLAVILIYGSAAGQSSAPQAPFVHKKKYVMGTVFEIVAYGAAQPASDSGAPNIVA